MRKHRDWLNEREALEAQARDRRALAAVMVVPVGFVLALILDGLGWVR